MGGARQTDLAACLLVQSLAASVCWGLKRKKRRSLRLVRVL